jgi:hypothetical protein
MPDAVQAFFFTVGYDLAVSHQGNRRIVSAPKDTQCVDVRDLSVGFDNSPLLLA